MENKRNRRIFSIKNELIKKSREAALSAIQIYNNPLITFKSESFIVLMNIAWTYLLHAYFKDKNIEYRYCKENQNRNKFLKTKHGAFKHWELEKCLNHQLCPLENALKDNLLFLIGIRHEIEHQMTKKIDTFLSGKFQACCINYNSTLKSLFGNDLGLEKITPIALQLFSFGENQVDELKEHQGLPQNLIDFIADFETDCSSTSDSRYSYRVIYMRENRNHESQADRAYRFIDENSAEGKEIHNVLLRNKQYKKLTQNKVVEIINSRGFEEFTRTDHLYLWKKLWKDADERNEKAKKFGELVVNNQWLWYEETWIPKVLELLQANISN
ncbi:TPA: DUF3644 domain-containing protein [Legionella pneumophila]|uniref:DUF3644 domain-containing protein n=1 Tax=Legionella pneumophila TaxID=446 RepID=UPI0007782A26|nr:DUF3644 domain-containing protein [Legionella pneumophila]HAT4451851.1 DUF3644 domain-containing protein [Legionella pneumophila]HAT7913735.1 DUF3644 domain-containing protein [Legionella pneumophila]HAT8642315.1 DUF3644 domain-containing protein [Legionella pneumophila]HAT8969479.1 DUF3644 domain-containing protein [Legionella pneumophila subsp. pneumophila]HAT9866654.1 DUF3644 domain-containing protein [Legionella pneumophila subsp. pneumophila]